MALWPLKKNKTQDHTLTYQQFNGWQKEEWMGWLKHQ